MENFELCSEKLFVKKEGNQYPDVNRKIWKVLKKLGIENITKKYRAIVCGSSVLTLFEENRMGNDLDLFFRNSYDLEEFGKLVSAFSGCEVIEDNNDMMHLKYKTKHLKLFKKFIGSPESVLTTFDFTISQVCFYPKENCFIMHEDFIKDMTDKELIINLNIPFPLGTISRISKYIRCGYKISDAQSMLLAFSINKYDLDNQDGLIDSIRTVETVREPDSVEELSEIMQTYY